MAPWWRIGLLQPYLGWGICISWACMHYTASPIPSCVT
jgi:hypothetical protein